MSIVQLRSRLIRPEFFTNQKLADLGDKPMLVFAGVWVIADREGRLEDNPRLIRAFTRPFDDQCDTEGILQSLHDSGFIVRYSVNGSKYIQVCDWNAMQSIHPEERQSQTPPPQQVTGLPQAMLKHGASTEEEEKKEVVIERETEAEVETEAHDTDDLPWDERNRLRSREQKR